MRVFLLSPCIAIIFMLIWATALMAQTPTTEVHRLGLSDDGVLWTELTVQVPVSSYVVVDFNGSEVWVIGSQYPPESIPLISSKPDCHCSAILSMLCTCEKKCYENDMGNIRAGTCVP